jgi:hypothetical protein
MDSLAQLNTVAIENVSFSAVANVVQQEDTAYTVRVPSVDLVKTLGNIQSNTVITHSFDWGNIPSAYQNVTVSLNNPGAVSNVSSTYAGNVLTITGIKSAQDYLGTVATVGTSLGFDNTGEFSHNSNVRLTGNIFNSGVFLYTVNVNLVNVPELFPVGNPGNLVYNFFGNNVNEQDSIVTPVSPGVLINTNNPAGLYTMTISTQDNGNAVTLTSTGPTLTTNTFSAVGNVGTLTLQGNIVPLNQHLANLAFVKSNAAVANVPSIGRGVRNLTYSLTNPANVVSPDGTRTQTYFSNFAQTEFANTAGNLKYRAQPGNVAVVNLFQSGSRDTGVNTLAYVGYHAGTLDPHWAYAHRENSNVGNANVLLTMIGLQANSASVLSGPQHVIGVSNNATVVRSAVSDLMGANIGNQSNTTARLFVTSSSPGSFYGNTTARTVGADAGDQFNSVIYSNVAMGSSTLTIQPKLTFNGTTFPVVVSHILAGPSGLGVFQRQSKPNNDIQDSANLTFSGSTYKGIHWWYPQSTSVFNPPAVSTTTSFVNCHYDLTTSNWPHPIMVNGFTKIIDPLIGQTGQLRTVPNFSGTSLAVWRGQTDIPASDLAQSQQIITMQVVLTGTTAYTDNLVSTKVTAAGYAFTVTQNFAGATPLGAFMTPYLGDNPIWPNAWLLRGQTYDFNVDMTASGANVYITTALGGGVVTPSGVTNNNIKLGTISFTPTSSTPDIVYFRGGGSSPVSGVDLENSQGGAFYIFSDTSSTSGRWTTVPGAFDIMKKSDTEILMVYTKYTGTVSNGATQSAGLYYRIITWNGSNLTFGTQVQVQNPDITGNIYGISMTASSTNLNGYTYVLCVIAPAQGAQSAFTTVTPIVTGFKF